MGGAGDTAIGEVPCLDEALTRLNKIPNAVLIYSISVVCKV